MDAEQEENFLQCQQKVFSLEFYRLCSLSYASVCKGLADLFLFIILFALIFEQYEC